MSVRPAGKLTFLGIVVFAALAVRIFPIVFERPIGRDIADYQNIAANLAAGRGLTLDIKAFSTFESPVSHYAGYERAPLLPALIFLFGLVLPGGAVLALLGPLLFLGVVAMVYDTLVRYLSPLGAFCCTLLVAVHPGLLEVSLTPLTEIPTLFFLAAALWAFFRLGSPAGAGLACAAAFLSRPGAAAAVFALAVAYGVQGRSKRSYRDLGLFIGCAVIGPGILGAINVASGAPLTLTPQSFLFRVLHFTDGLHYVHRSPVYESTWALLSENGATVVRQVAKNALAYVMALADSTRGLGFLLPFVPLAFYGLASKKLPAPAAVVAGMGLADLALYTVSWSTRDADRFLTNSLFAALLVLAPGIWLAFEKIGEDVRRSRFGSLGPAVLILIAAMWGASDVYRSYLAMREHQLGRPFTNNLETVWDRDDVRDMEAHLLGLMDRGKITRTTVIASNEPWLANHLTGARAALVPYDFEPEDWGPFVEDRDAEFVLLHEADWPANHHENLEALRAKLKSAGWRLESWQGEIELWTLPEPEAPETEIES